MGRKQLRQLVQEEHPGATCVRTAGFSSRVPPAFAVRSEGDTLGQGCSKVAAWRSAAEEMTAVA